MERPSRTVGVQRWLVYALGGGLGHLTRAVALSRRAVARGHRVTLLVNSPYARHVQLAGELGPADIVAIPPDHDRDRVAREVRATFDRTDIDALVVDTFPRGLAGELAPILPRLTTVKVLVHRLLCAEYVERASLRRFVDVYDRVLIPGEPAPLDDHPRARWTPPWLIRDHHELASPSRARRALCPDAAPGTRLILVVGSGEPEEIAEAAGLAHALRDALWRQDQPAAVVFSAPGHPGARWPLLPLLPAVDLLIGAGGYNTVHEARATATPLVAIARPRLYDRQALRLRQSERVSTTREALDRALAILHAEGRRAPLPYPNGTHAAVAEIETLCARPLRGRS